MIETGFVRGARAFCLHCGRVGRILSMYSLRIVKDNEKGRGDGSGRPPLPVCLYSRTETRCDVVPYLSYHPLKGISFNHFYSYLVRSEGARDEFFKIYDAFLLSFSAVSSIVLSIPL